MLGDVCVNIPGLFRRLSELGCLEEKDLRSTGDGFCAAVKSLSDILACRGISTVPGDSAELECRLFFDDWYLYALPCGEDFTYSLFKMREQEYDAKLGLIADGDTPGVTVSFIGMRTEILTDCLLEPDERRRRALNLEINRVVAHRGQRHNRTLKKYFMRSKARAAYLVAELYTDFIASLSEDGRLAVPEHYAAAHEKSGGRGRLSVFIEENNAAAGRRVCDHENIYIARSGCPTEHERLAILATHCGNVSFYSFAAELQFHALFLVAAARIPLPFVGRSAYDSAIRADMSIDDGEFTGPTPYYRSGSILVRRQRRCHRAGQRDK